MQQRHSMKKAPGKIVIFGQYKSGTTALFTKLKNSLPDDTRLLFEPRAYVADEKDADRWILSKTILKFPGHPEPVDYQTFLGFDRKICLCRDPRDWLVSFTLFLCQEKESIYTDDKAVAHVLDYLYRKESAPRSLPIAALLDYLLQAPPALSRDKFLRRTHDLQKWAIEFCAGLQDMCMLRYEDLVDGHLLALQEYLGFALTGTSQVDRQFDHVPRTCSHGDWKNWFTREDEDVFAPFFTEYIRHYGYSEDWSPSATPHVRAAHGSAYVARIIERKRALREGVAH
jgi:hypothetical protein